MWHELPSGTCTEQPRWWRTVWSCAKVVVRCNLGVYVNCSSPDTTTVENFLVATSCSWRSWAARVWWPHGESGSCGTNDFREVSWTSPTKLKAVFTWLLVEMSPLIFCRAVLPLQTYVCGNQWLLWSHLSSFSLCHFGCVWKRRLLWSSWLLPGCVTVYDSACFYFLMNYFPWLHLNFHSLFLLFLWCWSVKLRGNQSSRYVVLKQYFCCGWGLC